MQIKQQIKAVSRAGTLHMARGAIGEAASHRLGMPRSGHEFRVVLDGAVQRDLLTVGPALDHKRP